MLCILSELIPSLTLVLVYFYGASPISIALLVGCCAMDEVWFLVHGATSMPIQLSPWSLMSSMLVSFLSEGVIAWPAALLW